MTRKFNAGDRVRFGESFVFPLINTRPGDVGTVLRLFGSDVSPGYTVCVDHRYETLDVSEHHLERLEPARSFIVVSAVRGPAARPHVHPNRTAAETEAARLARDNPGVEFAVYERVSARVAEVTVKEVS